MPIPVELIVVVVGTTVSYFMKFNEQYNIKIIGFLPLGLFIYLFIYLFKLEYF